MVLGERGYEPSGRCWLLSRQVRAQHRRAAILMDHLVHTEISSVSICFTSAVFYFWFLVLRGQNFLHSVLTGEMVKGTPLSPVSSLYFWLSPWAEAGKFWFLLPGISSKDNVFIVPNMEAWEGMKVWCMLPSILLPMSQMSPKLLKSHRRSAGLRLHKEQSHSSLQLFQMQMMIISSSHLFHSINNNILHM